MDVLKIIDHYYGEGDSKLKSLLLNHSQSVAQRALKVAENHPELNLDREFLYDASMLHDIGIIECHAPSIYWTDSEGHCLSRITSSCHIINARDDRRKSNLLCRQVLLKNTPWRGEDVGTCRTIAITLWQRRS